MSGLALAAPAKINLTLDVTGKRPDGFHDISSIMHQISLYDVVTVKKGSLPKTINIFCDHGQVPSGPDNLAWKAAREMIGLFGIDGIDITIRKSIPVAAGLAGGSTDAAAVIKGINRLWGLSLSLEEQMEIGARIGSDVPFCLMGGTALAEGRGEILTPLDCPLTLYLVLINPGFPVSTTQIYDLLDTLDITERPHTDLVSEGIRQGDIDKILDNWGNVMEMATIKMYPQLEAIKKDLMRYGAVGALMSGSGPTVFGVFMNYDQASRAGQTLQRLYPGTFICSTFTGEELM